MKKYRNPVRILQSSVATLLTFAAMHQVEGANATWNGASSGTWHSITNWTPNTGFPGDATAATAITGEGTAADIASFTGTNISTNVGINMNTMSGNVAGGGLSLGAIDMNRTAAGNLQIGNNSAVNGVLQLNGATVNGIANTLIRVTGTVAADLTIANVNTGTGTQTMGLRLGNANGFFTVDTNRTLTISSIISQLVGNTGFTKNGAGTLSLSAANTYNGAVLVTDGVLRVSNATAFGTGTSAITVTNSDGSASNTNEIQITGGITVARNLILENTASSNAPNARSGLQSTSTVNANANIWSGSITFKGGSNQTLQAGSAPMTLSGAIINDSTTPSTSIFFRGLNTGTVASTGTINLGAANLFKTDAGTWILNNTTSAISGATQVADGTLTVGANNALSTTAPITIGQGTATSGTLNIAAGISQTVASLTVAAGSTGTQRVTGPGALDTGSTNRTFLVNDSVGIPQDLIISAPITGSGGFSKTGAGTLAVSSAVDGSIIVGLGTLTMTGTAAGSVAVNAGLLNGTGTYNGGVTINAARLEGSGSFNSGLTVEAGGILSPGTDLTNGNITTSSLTFGAGASTVNLSIGTGGEVITNTGGITANGTTTINFTPSGSVSGTINLITHDGSFVGTTGFTPGPLFGRVTGGLVNTGTAIALQVTGNSKVVWTGTGAPGTTWDIGTTQNWKLQAGGATEFLQGDDLIFDDTGINAAAIDLGAGANPARADFQNTAAGAAPLYKIVGAGGMGAAMVLDKTGDGQVTLAPVNAALAANGSAHTYTGATNVNNGTLTLDYTGLTGANAATARVINPISAITIGGPATLKVQRNNVATVLANDISGTGTLLVDITNGGTTGSQAFGFGGNNVGFTGTIKLSPTGGGTTGTFRTMNSAVTGSAPVTAFGSALIDVDAGAQMWGAAGTYSNNIKVTGAGFSEPAGGATPDADLVALGFANYAGIGAIRMDTGSIFNGNITLEGSAKLQAFGGTAVVNGSITRTNATDVLVVGGGNNNVTNTLVLAGDNSTLGKIWVNSAGSGGITAFDVVQIGNNGVTGTLGSGDVILHADAARGSGIRFSRADGYTLLPGQNILPDVGASADHARLNLFVNTTGTGFTINNNTIDLSDGVAGGIIYVAGNGGANGVNGSIFNINGASALVEAGNFYVGDQATFAGIVNQTDGTVNLTGHMRVGHYGTESSFYNLSGGTLNFLGAEPATTPSTAGATEVTTGGLYVGIDGTGNFIQTGAAVVNTKFVLLDNRGLTAGTDTYTLTSGNLNLTSKWGVIARNPTSTQVLLDSGTISNSAAAGTAVMLDTPITVIGSGGLLNTSANATSSLVLTRDVTGAGNTLTIAGSGKISLNPNSKTVLDGTSDGLGSQIIDVNLTGGATTPVEKVGTGTTTFSGANSYTGPTTITAGTLAISAAGSLGDTAVAINTGGTFTPSGNVGAGGSITLNAGGTLNVGGNASGLAATTVSSGALSLNGGTVNFDFTGTAVDRIDTSATNGLTINATTANILLGPSGWVTGNYPAYTYAGTVQGAGAGAITISNLVGHSTVAFVNNAAGTVNLSITAVTNKWVGGGASPTAWDINNTLNWNAGDQKYLEGDNVLMDDTAVNFTPALVANVSPSSVIFANNSNNYSLGGAAGITGVTDLVMNGVLPTSTAALAPVNAVLTANASAHTYTGDTNVNSGTLVLDYTGLTGTNAATARVINSASPVSIATGATLKAIRGDAAFTFSNPLTGDGTLELNPHSAAGGVVAHNIVLNGANTGFTGTIVLAAPVTGTYRLGTPTQAALGSADIEVKSGAQLFLGAGTYTNNLTISGSGFADSSGNIGALRIDGTTYAGNITVAGVARIGAHNNTGTVSGNISGDDLEVNVTNFNNSYTVIFTGTNSYGTTTIGGGNTQTAGVPTMRLNIGNGGTSGTLGTGAVTINGDSASGVLGFDRADGYTLAQPITGAGSQITRTFIDINTLGAGFDSAGYPINLGTAAAGGSFRVGQGRAGAVATITGTLNAATATVGSGASLPGSTLTFGSGANVAVNALTVGSGANSPGATLNIINGAVVTTSSIALGSGANSPGATLNIINGAVVTTNSINVATASTNATVNIDSGVVVNTNNFFLGEQAGWSGTANQTGGTVNVASQFRVGHWPNETSTYSLSGAGTLNLTAAAGVTNPSNTGNTEQNGGIYLGIDGTGIMNQSGGTVTTNWVVLDNREISVGTDQYNLSGGNLNIKSSFGIIRRNTSAEFNFTGGTIQNVGVGVVANIDAPLNIGSGGSGTPTIDTNGATNAFTVVQGMTGSGDLKKVGLGTLALNAANPLWTGDLYAEGGTAVVRDVLGNGTTSVIVDSSAGVDADDPAQVIFTASQTLDALIIGDGATVTLASSFPPPAPLAAEGFGNAGGELAGAPIQGVPEPGSAALVFGGMLTLLGLRRRK